MNNKPNNCHSHLNRALQLPIPPDARARLAQLQEMSQAELTEDPLGEIVLRREDPLTIQ